MSGFVTGISISPVSPYDVYVRTDVGGCYRFNRSTKRWKALLDSFPTNARAEGVEAICADPVDPSTVYAAFWRQNVNDGDTWTYIGEVWKSTDKGATWTPTGLKDLSVEMEANGEFRAETGERLAVDPNKTDVIYFASRNDGLLVKKGTAAWVKIASGLPAESTLFWAGENRTDRPGFTWVIVDKNSGTSGTESPRVYAGAYGSGVWMRSTVNGTWTRITPNTTGVQTKPLRAALAGNGDLYVAFGDQNQFGSGGSLQRYRSGTWTDITPSGNPALCGIAVHSDNQQLLVSGNTNIWKSSNQGAAWTDASHDLRYPQNPSAPPYMTTSLANNLVVSLAFDPADTNAAWFTNGFGTARALNANTAAPAWRWEMLGQEEFVGVMTIAPPTDPTTNFYTYTAVMDKAGFKQTSLDYPANKNIAASGIPVPSGTPEWIAATGTTTFPVPIDSPTGCSSIDVAWNNPQQAAFVGYHQVVDTIPLYGKTNDHGETWTAFGNVPTVSGVKGAAGQIAVDRRGTNLMCWVPKGFYPHYTTDGGATWLPSKIAGTNTNLPSSWANDINARVRSGVLVADKRTNGRMYYYDAGQSLFYVSQDSGATWTLTVQNVLPTYRIKIKIEPNPFLDNEVWFSGARNTEEVDSKGSSLYRSTNGGQSFTIVSTVASCEYVAVGKGEGLIPYYVFIFGRVGNATQDTMYRSADGGLTWQAISDPTVNKFNGICHMSADPRIANLLSISTVGRAHQYLFGANVSSQIT